MAETRIEHVLGRHALATIQSTDDESMYVEVTSAALYMATAGFLSEAEELLGRLWACGWPHSANCWLADQALTILWDAAGRRPHGVPFEPKAVNRIELAHRYYVAADRWNTPISPGNWQELDGLDLLRQSMALAMPATVDGPMPPRAEELEALAGLEKYLSSQGERVGWIDANATCLSAELAARTGHNEEATRIAVRWAERYPTWHLNSSFELMASNRYMAPLLLQQTLAAPLGLGKDNCSRYLNDLLDAADRRQREGRTLNYGSLPWKKLLDEVGRLAIAADPESFSDTERVENSLRRAPAADQAIQAAEARLHLALPMDYVDFLRTSNGLSQVSVTTPPLRPIETVDLLHRIEEPELFAMLKEYPGDDFGPAMDRCLLVSDCPAEDMVLLIPPLTAVDTWETWFFGHWVPGEIRYPSFRHYIEQQLHYLVAQ